MKQSKELTMLLLLAEKLMIAEQKGFEDDTILYSLFQIANAYLDQAQEVDIVAIELASYLPFKTNPDLDNHPNINVAFVERPKEATKKMS